MNDPRPHLVGTVVIGLLLVGACTSTAAAATVSATTDTGPVEGLVAPTVTKFLGIPYAAPPVGALRWQPPQPHAPWSTPVDGTVFGDHCPQATSPFGLAADTEDCLFLNVYTPNHKGFASDVRRRKPVMVWIHGGAFTVGESDVYDPTRLVELGNVVVVTINYRLGALGFLAHPALTAESPDHVSGNYGLLDQQFALKWVQRNIAAFGGNPKRVTIFGESAGGFSVHAQMASPAAAGLFHRAIVESGAFFTQPTLATAEGNGSTLATAVGCTDQSAACLRALPVDQVLANQGSDLTSWSPVIDGKVLPDSVRTLFVTGQFNRVPVIEGSNHDEFRLFVALAFDLAGGPLAADQYTNAIATLLNVPSSVAAALAANYPLANFASPDLALAALATDAAFACNAAAADRWLARYTPTYAYEFNDANAPQVFVPPVSFSYGASHASEIPYLFDVPEAVPAVLTADQQQLSETMILYWTHFARSGKPRVPHAPRWPKVRPAALPSFSILSLVPPTPALEASVSFSIDHHCTLWDTLLGNP